jgi:hypothetical protein
LFLPACFSTSTITQFLLPQIFISSTTNTNIFCLFPTMFSSNANPDKIPGSGTKAPTSELKQAAETAGQKRKAEEALVIPDALNTAVGA